MKPVALPTHFSGFSCGIAQEFIPGRWISDPRNFAATPDFRSERRFAQVRPGPSASSLFDSWARCLFCFRPAPLLPLQGYLFRSGIGSPRAGHQFFAKVSLLVTPTPVLPCVPTATRTRKNVLVNHRVAEATEEFTEETEKARTSRVVQCFCRPRSRLSQLGR